MRRDTARLLLVFLFIGCLFKNYRLYGHPYSHLPEMTGNKLSDKELLASSSRIVIAVDLGTTYSRVGVCDYESDTVKTIPNDQGNFMTPSLIAFTDNASFVGEAAKNQTVLYPEKTISFDPKRFIGKKFEDEEVQSAMELFPNKIVNKDGKPYFHGENKLFSPEEMTAMFLTKMKETAEAFLDKEIKDAVITIPAHFNEAQRQATKDAGTMAGLNVLELIPEPKAAATAYYRYREVYEENILVFDLGGATLDVTILTADDGAFEIHSTNSDIHLGGNDFDQRVMEYFMVMIKNKHGKDITNDNKALVKLRKECERAKIALSNQDQVQVEIESLFDGVDFSEPLTRAQFEDLNNDLFNKTIGFVKKVMEEAGLQRNQIDDIVLVGGSAKIPKVRQLLKDYFDENEVNEFVDPEIDEIVLIRESSETFRPLFKDYFDGKEANNGVDLGEAVALGAAITAANTYSRERWFSFLRLELIPYGVRTAGDRMTRLIPGLQLTPTKKTRVFTTNRDNQTRISIEIYEGSKSFTKSCKFFGKFELSGIPPAPRGTPRIEITTEVDIYNDVYIEAEEKVTGKSEKFRVLYSNSFHYRLIVEEIRNMRKEARMKLEEEAKTTVRPLIRQKKDAELNNLQQE